MSITIKGGFALKATKNLDAAYYRLPEFKKAIFEAADNLGFDTLIDLATRILDRRQWEGSYHGPSTSCFRTAGTIVGNDLKNNEKSGFNQQFKLGFALADFGGVIGMVFSPNKALSSTFMRLPGVADYSYSHLIDRPKKVSERKWKQRESDWQDLFPIDSSESPTNTLLSVDIIAPYTMRAKSRDNLNVMPRLLRLQKLAEEVTMEQCKVEFGLETPEDIVTFLTRSSEYSRRLEQNKIEMEPTIIEDVTLELLQKV